MANILVVSGSYYPYATANAVCMKEFEKSLINQGNHVVYAIKRHDIDTEEKTTEDGIEIYHIPRAVDEFYATCEKLKKAALPQPLSMLFRLALFMIKVVVTVYAKIRYGSVRKYSETVYINNYAKKISDIVNEKKIDTIISISMPFLSHKAVLKYLSLPNAKSVKWISFMIDSYSQKYGVSDVDDKIKEEIEVFAASDRVVLLNVLEESYQKEPFLKYKNKFRYIPLPLLNLGNKDDRTDGIMVNDKKVDCVFAGTLYDETSSLDFFSKFVIMLDSDKFRFHFMGKIYPRNKEILQKLNRESKAEIIVYGVMPYSFAVASVEKADILINIGNLSTNQIPSKVFQYITTKKPILTFYKIENDPSLPLLGKYPLAYNVYEQSKLSETCILEFYEFYERSKDVVLEAEALKKIYAGETTEDVCRQFSEYVNHF